MNPGPMNLAKVTTVFLILANADFGVNLSLAAPSWTPGADDDDDDDDDGGLVTGVDLDVVLLSVVSDGSATRPMPSKSFTPSNLVAIEWSAVSLLLLLLSGTMGGVGGVAGCPSTPVEDESERDASLAISVL